MEVTQFQEGALLFLHPQEKLLEHEQGKPLQPALSPSIPVGPQGQLLLGDTWGRARPASSCPHPQDGAGSTALPHYDPCSALWAQALVSRPPSHIHPTAGATCGPPPTPSPLWGNPLPSTPPRQARPPAPHNPVPSKGNRAGRRRGWEKVMEGQHQAGLTPSSCRWGPAAQREHTGGQVESQSLLEQFPQL